jgi:hypothetical protein
MRVGGTATGAVTINGSGAIEINDDYLQLPNGVLTLELDAGSTTGTIIDVADGANLAGTLSVELSAGYTPMLGSEFAIVTAGDMVNGEFDEVNLPALPGDLSWELSYNDDSVVLRVVENNGDFNHDGTVDATDYVMWRKTDGSPAGYNAWRTNFGRTGGSGSMSETTVPEPASLSLVIGAIAGCCGTRQMHVARFKTR